jgi:hypothetical protein
LFEIKVVFGVDGILCPKLSGHIPSNILYPTLSSDDQIYLKKIC